MSFGQFPSLPVMCTNSSSDPRTLALC